MNKNEIKVEVKEVEPVTVAYIRHVGPYAGDGALFERLYGQIYAWAGPRGLIDPESTPCLNIYHDNPAEHPQKKHIVDNYEPLRAL